MDAVPADRSNAPQDYDDLIARITDWAAAAPDVRGAFILGSRARTDHPADEWSDLDVLVFARAYEQFIESEDWLAALGPYWLTFIERTGDGQSLERRTLFEGGLDVDLAFFPAEFLDTIAENIPPDVADVLRRGVKVLVDKDGKLERIRQAPLPEARLFQKPSEREFVNATTDFWYHTLWTVRHLRRGELWWAIGSLNGHMNALVEQMLVWHAHACHGGEIDTWLRGRFLEEWADRRAVKQLGFALAHYDRDDMARALRATMDLYRWLQDETAAKWAYRCPTDGEHAAARLATQLIDQMG